MNEPIAFLADRHDGDTDADEGTLLGLVYMHLTAERGENFSSFSGWVEPEAAALVKSAPALLQLCQDMVAALDDSMVEAHDSGGLAALGLQHGESCCLCRARTVIAQAKGEQPIELPKATTYEVLF